jgi:hypothetical protein
MSDCPRKIRGFRQIVRKDQKREKGREKQQRFQPPAARGGTMTKKITHRQPETDKNRRIAASLPIKLQTLGLASHCSTEPKVVHPAS